MTTVAERTDRETFFDQAGVRGRYGARDVGRSGGNGQQVRESQRVGRKRVACDVVGVDLADHVG